MASGRNSAQFHNENIYRTMLSPSLPHEGSQLLLISLAGGCGHSRSRTDGLRTDEQAMAAISTTQKRTSRALCDNMAGNRGCPSHAIRAIVVATLKTFSFICKIARSFLPPLLAVAPPVEKRPSAVVNR